MCRNDSYLGVTPYFQISQSYLADGRYPEAEAFAYNLPGKFPGKKKLHCSLLTSTLKPGKKWGALKNLGHWPKLRILRTTQSVLAEGTLYLNDNKYDVGYYWPHKINRIKSDLYESQYGLGAAYINKGGICLLKANEIMDVNKYYVQLKSDAALPSIP